MRIIFQNGEVAELNNVDRIICHNEMDALICHQGNVRFWNGWPDDWNPRYKGEDINEQHASDTEMGNGSVFERNVAQEGSQHAGQTGICDISEEAGRKGTP